MDGHLILDPTEMAERSLAGWVLGRPEKSAMAAIREFLRAEDFGFSFYGAVYRAALHVAEQDGSVDLERLYGALATMSPDTSSIHLMEIELGTPAGGAPRHWARAIVEQSARRRVQTWALRLGRTSGRFPTGAVLDSAGRELLATLVQLEKAGSLYGDKPLKMQHVSATFDWRGALAPRRSGSHVAQDELLTEAEQQAAGWDLLALCLQRPDIGTTLLVKEGVTPADLLSPGSDSRATRLTILDDRYQAALLRAMTVVAGLDKTINSVSVYIEMLSSGCCGEDRDDMQRLAEQLENLERRALPDVDVVRHRTHRLVLQRRLALAATPLESGLGPAREQTAKIVDTARERIDAARLAARQVDLTRPKPAVVSPPPARGNPGPRNAAPGTNRVA